MPLEPFQTVRGHRQKWHLNRSKPSEGTRKNDTWTVPNRSTGATYTGWFWIIFCYFFMVLISFDIFRLSFDNLSLLWFFGVLDTSQTKPVKLKRQNHLAFWRRRCHRGEWFWSPRENSLGMMNMNIGISPWSPGILEKSNQRVRYHHPPSLPFAAMNNIGSYIV